MIVFKGQGKDQDVSQVGTDHMIDGGGKDDSSVENDSQETVRSCILIIVRAWF